MTHYLGSKARHAAEITSITLAGRKPGQAYVEPFVGGGNVIVKVPQEQGPRIANDLNAHMVALLDALGNKDWVPPETMTESAWKKIMKWKAEEHRSWEDMALFAFAATGPTFGSMWCGGWAKDEAPKPPGTRYRQARENCLRDAPGLKGIKFHSGPFDAFDFPPESLVYCDPPYFGTAGYDGATQKIPVGESLAKNNWSAKKFWVWADKLVDAGHTVFVSEYMGPNADCFPPDPPSTGEAADLKALVLNARSKQQAPRGTVDPLETIAAVDLVNSMEQRLKVKGIAEKIARWRLVWEKEVAVNIAAASVDTDKGEAAVRKVERLFSRC
jgi:DNA adenine methylase